VSTTGNVTIGAPSSGTALITSAVAAGIVAQWGDGTVTVQDSFAATKFASYTVGAHSYVIGTNSADRITVTSTGNVTIAAPGSGTAVTINGTAATPGTAQRWQGTTTAAHSLQINSSGGNAYFGVDSSSGGTLVTGGGAYGLCLVTESANPINFATTNALRMQIGAAGNVTIAAPSSGPALTVGGTAGWNGKGGEAIQTAPPLATDDATAWALANDMRARLIALGVYS
jgi:hypothetical protein